MTAARAALAALLLAGSAAVVASAPTDRTATAVTSARAEVTPSDLQSYEDYNVPYDGLFHFVRVRYDVQGGGGFGRRRRGGGMAPWSHDWPRAERNFLKIIEETTFVGAQTEGSNIHALDDPEIFNYPILYIVEVGYWFPTDEEVEKLREYLLKGGFMIVDDFREPNTLQNLENQLARVLPGYEMVVLDETNPVFDSFFRIVPADVIPPYGPRNPVWFGVYEDNDPSKSLMMVINYNNDIAEYWEFSDRGYFPIDLSNEAYKLGVNYIVYGLTH